MALVKMSADSLVDLLDELGIDKAETRTGELVRLLRKVKAAPQDQNIDPAFLAKLFYDDPGIFIASLVDSGFFNRHELNKFVKWAIGTQGHEPFFSLSKCTLVHSQIIRVRDEGKE